MGDFQLQFPSGSSVQDSKLVSALIEALQAQRVGSEDDVSPTPNRSEDAYEVVQPFFSGKREHIRPDQAPKHVHVGAVNPYALVEAMLGRKIDKHSIHSAKVLSDILQTEYDELFDMKFDSVLFASLKLNEKERMAEELSEKDMKLLKERDLVTPDLSCVKELQDLEDLGFKDLKKARVKVARMQNGKVYLVLNNEHQHLGKKVSNSEVTRTVNELITPFRLDKNNHWVPPNGSWRNLYDQLFKSINTRLVGNLTQFHIREDRDSIRSFDDPIQGCTSNSWLIAALFSVFWSDPHHINRATFVFPEGQEYDNYGKNHQMKRLHVKFHDKGGSNNSKTENVEVNYEIPINNSNNEPMYCRSSNGADIWPSLYEKAFAKWISSSKGSNSSDRPDITQTHAGDPIKAMAQINGQDPHYFCTEKHSAGDLLGLVRCNSLNLKTINPMTAWTHATGHMYRGSNLVANHAYSVLGYTMLGEKQYIVLRNPWGVTEPIGLTSYLGMLERVTPETWQPAALLDNGGVFALEAEAFKHAFQYVGVAN